MTTTPHPLEIVRTVRHHVDTLLLAKVVAEAERERVDKIQRRVLSEGQYIGRRPVKRGPNGIEWQDYRVTEPGDAWHIVDGDAQAYHGRMDAIHKANGSDLPEGHCPALVAGHLQVQAEGVLIEAAEEFFPGVTNARLNLEKRREYLDLLIGLVVNSPGYRKPRV